MLFSSLAERLQASLAKFRKKGKLTPQDVKSGLREMKLALLEADVNYKVVKDFIKKVEERAVGAEVMESLTPGQQVVKIVRDELGKLMGSAESRLTYAPHPPTVIMLAGLQGSGKTTSAAKLALFARKDGKQPLLVAADIYRPAAVKQLVVLAKQEDIPVFQMGVDVDPVDIAKAAHAHAKKHGNDVIIIDTAGRLHIDQQQMDELKRVKGAARPHEILLVVDAMTGQDAVSVAEGFNEALGIDGVILTKMDADTRGGAALSVTSITGCPIKFASFGEKLTPLEKFHPDRMASRILGMGDVLSLIDKAEAALDRDKQKQWEEKLRKNEFTLEDFLEQLEQVRKMGPLDQLAGMVPGLGKMGNVDFDERELDRVEAIINSMTREERQNPEIIKSSRRKRIARGSGTDVRDVNRLLKQFKQTRKMIRQLGQFGKKKRFPGLPWR